MGEKKGRALQKGSRRRVLQKGPKGSQKDRSCKWASKLDLPGLVPAKGILKKCTGVPSKKKRLGCQKGKIQNIRGKKHAGAQKPPNII